MSELQKPTDLPARLRDPSVRLRGDVATMAEAADEIDRLRAALHRIAVSTGCVEACPCWAKLRREAERALAHV